MAETRVAQQFRSSNFPAHVALGVSWRRVRCLARAERPRLHRAAFTQLLSQSLGIPRRKWELDFHVEVDAFSIDPEQGLLVLLEDRPPRTIRLHLRTMRANESHPLAAHAHVDYEADASDVPFSAGDDYMAQVMGDRLFLLRTDSGLARTRLVIWNWRTGELVYSAAERVSRHRAFTAPPRACIIPERRGRPCALGVEAWRFNVACRDVRASEGYSKGSDGWRYLSAAAHLNPPPAATESSPPPRSLLSICIEVVNRNVRKPYMMFVDSEHMLSFLPPDDATASRNIRWEERGPGSTSTVEATPFHSRWPCSVHGYRYVTYPAGPRIDPFWRRIRLLDSNPYQVAYVSAFPPRVASHGSDDFPELCAVRADEAQESTFEDEVRCWLPFVETVSGKCVRRSPLGQEELILD